MTLADFMNKIDNAISTFVYGECYIDEVLKEFSFNEEGMKRRWDWYECLWKSVFEFSQQRFPKQDEDWYRSICDLQMSQIRERIERIESEFDCYRSIVLRYASEAEFADSHEQWSLE